MAAFPIMAPLPPEVTNPHARSSRLESVIYHCRECGHQIEQFAR